MTEELPRELALRVALAARALPDASAGDLLDILDTAVGLPLTVTKLNGLTVKAFRKAGGEAYLAIPGDTLRQVVALLKGDEASADGPELEDYKDGDMPGSIRVACASNSGELLDGHFGSCAQFLIYQVSPSETRLIDLRPAIPDDLEIDEDDPDVDKNKIRADQIADCQILYVVSIGGPPVAKGVRNDIHPIKRPNGGDARAIASELQDVLETPPPWLAKVLGHKAEDRVRFEAEEVE